jgi:molybdopterin molybdotransferase
VELSPAVAVRRCVLRGTLPDNGEPGGPKPASLPSTPPSRSRVSVPLALASVPTGATSILRKEIGQITQDADGKLLLALNDRAQDREPQPGQHIRHAGEEAAAGEVLIPAGTLLNPAHIALAAEAGYDELQIEAKPLVATVLTGAEVVSPGIPAPGQVRDTFGPQLGTVISLLGGVPENPHGIGDSYDEWLSALGSSEALAGEQPDVNITTGGTGPSGTDHLRRAVAALGGRLLLDGIARRPGHPAVLAELPDGRFVVGFLEIPWPP